MEEKRSSRVSDALGLVVMETGSEEGEWEMAPLDDSDWLEPAVRLDGGRRLAPFARS